MRASRWTIPWWIWISFLIVFFINCGNTNTKAPRLASHSDIQITSSKPGITPFISLIRLEGSSLKDIEAIRFIIATKPNKVSKPIDVSYSINALKIRGYAPTASGIVTLPVFGLYAGYANKVTLKLEFRDMSEQSIQTEISTKTYVDPNGIYDHPGIIRQRTANKPLEFDYFVLKSSYGTPVILDTDAEIRWVASGITASITSIFFENHFIIGDQGGSKIYQLELDGTIRISNLFSSSYQSFHHNIDPGKFGLLIELNTADNIESTAAEITASGVVLKDWDFANLISTHMRNQGDDPSAFVRPAVDWFHQNAAAYDASDDSLIVSSRENFVIKFDYQTGEILWIFGDPTKYWYTFPSLRAKALHLDQGGLYPIGQHAISIRSDGRLMLFNNGGPSFNQPAGAPIGESRSYSSVSIYSIDKTTMKANEDWRFDYNQTILSDICSSVYEMGKESFLVCYSTSANRTKARLVGLNINREVIFDFEYGSPWICGTSWNAQPIAFSRLRIE